MLVFEWSEAKSLKNKEERGFGFDFASLIFEADVLDWVDDRKDYGEKRMVALGEVDGVILVVAYTDRPGARRIISARPANRKEREKWRSYVES